MRYHVRLTKLAERDVERILDWFRQEDALAAGQKWLDQLWAKLSTLEIRPERCAVSDYGREIGLELRELHFGRRKGVYQIFFRVDGATVFIVHVRHASRRPLGDEIS